METQRENKPSVSVVVPVLNEKRTVGKVISMALQNPTVLEVIVIDDGSIDGTPEIARGAGARVITSTLLGKGASMEDGMRVALGDFILYLDGDLHGLEPDVVRKMVDPLLAGEADFVKARFERQSGRVTILTARPLIKTYFPELAHFDQPLSGVMAARKSLLEKLRFENDYGVDVGLFIDAFLQGARVHEVHIGELQHASHPLPFLEDMATQVARTILDRAGTSRRLRSSYLTRAHDLEKQKCVELDRVFHLLGGHKQIALFDMDGVLLDGRFILELARRTDREDRLKCFLDRHDMRPDVRMQQIGAIFTGIDRAVFESVALSIPLMVGAVETIISLRKMGYKVGLVTDSYHIASEIVRRRVFADFSFAHVMPFKQGKATGKVELCPAMIHPDGCAVHDHCKVNVLLHIQERLGISARNILAVGDGLNDVCLLKAAGRSIAFRPKATELLQAAQFVVEDHLTGTLPLVA